MKESIKKYIKSGGDIYRILHMDTLRDGGNAKIDTNTDKKIYIHKDNATFHSGYPLTDDNLIHNELEIEYIKLQIENYIEGIYNHLERLNVFKKLLEL